MRLIVVRHGETLYNLEDRLTGQSDIPLSSLGERQATLVGTFLATEQVDVVVSSDLQRARKTAMAIAAHHDLLVEEDPRYTRDVPGRLGRENHGGSRSHRARAAQALAR